VGGVEWKMENRENVKNDKRERKDDREMEIKV
jgi:hypothetical protein